MQFFGVNMVKNGAIDKVFFAGTLPPSKGLVYGNRFSLGSCLAYLACALAEMGR